MTDCSGEGAAGLRFIPAQFENITWVGDGSALDIRMSMGVDTETHTGTSTHLFNTSGSRPCPGDHGSEVPGAGRWACGLRP